MRIPTNNEVTAALIAFDVDSPAAVQDAIDMFYDLVQPLPKYESVAMEGLFGDYLLWDYEYEPGRTIALDMAANDHSLDEWARAEYTRLLPIESNTVFKDVFDGTVYEIHDEAIRPNWDMGSLGCRVAQDEDGSWHPVGNALLHDNAEFSDDTYHERVPMVDDLRRIIGGHWAVRSVTLTY